MRKYEPLAADSPMIGDLCWACRVEFKAGDDVTLKPVAPVPEDVIKSVSGKPYTSLASPVHWKCRNKTVQLNVEVERG